MSRAWLPALSGVLYYLAFHPADLGPLAWFALIPLILHAVHGPGGRRGFLAAWAGGALCFTLGTLWVRHTALAGPLVIGIYKGLYWGVFSWGIRRLTRRAGWPLPLSVPALWVGLEYARGHVLGGMPVLLAGYSQHAVLPLVQVADLGGVWLLSALVAFVNGVAARALLLERARKAWAVAGLSVVALAFGYGYFRLATIRLEDGPKLGLIQPNIPQDVKNLSKEDVAGAVAIFRKHVTLTRELVAREPDLDLVLWPESVIYEPLLYDGEEGRYVDTFSARRLRGPAEEAGKWVLVGTQVTVHGPGRDRVFHNSAVLVSPEGRFAGRFDKVRLIQFAERYPLQWLGSKKIAEVATSIPNLFEFTPGTGFPVLEAGPVRVGVSICGEVMYPDISRNLAGAGAPVLVNISNDGWFRDSAELDQMLAMARFRAVENRRPFVRATNTGISAFLDPTGRIQRVLEGPGGRVKEVEGTLAARVRTTDAAAPGRALGDWVPWLSAGAALAGLVLALSRKADLDLFDTVSGRT